MLGENGRKRNKGGENAKNGGRKSARMIIATDDQDPCLFCYTDGEGGGGVRCVSFMELCIA